MAIGKRDRAFLVALGVFLVGLGYYLFLLDPLMSRQAKLRKQASGLRRTLVQERAKAGELKQWRAHYDQARQEVADLLGGVTRELLSDNNTEVIKALLHAAEVSGVQLRMLTPQTVLKVRQDGTRTAARQFSLQGKGDSGAFFRFLGELKGMHLEDVNASVSSNDNSISFLMNLTVVSTTALQGIDLPPAGVKAAASTPIANPFGVKAAAVAPLDAGQKPTATGPSQTVPESASSGDDRTLDLKGLQLVGVASLGGRGMAVVESSAAGTCLFLWEGEQLQDMTLSEVQADAVVLSKGDLHGTLKLPAETGPASGAAGSGKANGAGPGKLGLRLCNVTPLRKEATDYPGSGGLDVVLPRSDSGAILKGDIIAAINGVPTPNLDVAQQVLDTLRADDLLTVKLWRTGRWVTTGFKAVATQDVPADTPPTKE
ncbi:MAG: hypothetical protein A3K19_07025 [Lentisphaerae bacterium RIFOXYB12_FULL_65_16]|nr:MAG: hypothetical protein A3K18_12300 [Lentisphaerae bacterium RIFOXYA12_64_32]OGV93274.1 MAG: hypothetical protein A3K19_07025 [Lentisphaerae bacterium RIFOXYB12_FULL_65_16]